MSRDTDAQYMSIAYRLAEKGLPFTSPNPAVGAIVVKKGRIIGRGYHYKAGLPHAEIEALNDCRESARGATMYVTLEPCTHYGKTPPCVEAIVKSGIKRVVVGAVDPNPLVNGRGIMYLKRKGIEVSLFDERNSSDSLNCGFAKWIRSGLPFVILKIATTLDGKIADRYGDSKYITSYRTREFVHRLRYLSDAILVGAGTVRKDNPRLTSRLIKGMRKKITTRIVLDGRLSLSTNYRVFANDGATRILLTSETAFNNRGRRCAEFERGGIRVVPLKSHGTRIELNEILKYLGSMNVLYLLVEGGSELFTEFLESSVVDNLIMTMAPSLIGGRGKGFFLQDRRIKESTTLYRPAEVMFCGNDLIFNYYKEGSDVYRLDRVLRAGC